MQIARGSMGEYGIIGESILGEYASATKDDCLSAVEYSDDLYSFNSEKFIYVHTLAFCYNKCKINSTLKAALMIAEIRGEH